VHFVATFTGGRVGTLTWVHAGQVGSLGVELADALAIAGAIETQQRGQSSSTGQSGPWPVDAAAQFHQSDHSCVLQQVGVVSDRMTQIKDQIRKQP
jgi:hypothetical protein